MTESTWKAVKDALLEKGSKEVGNGQRKVQNNPKETEIALKSLKDSVLNNPFVKEMMLNQLEDISLGSENLLANTLSGLTILRELENIIVRNELANESELEDLKNILLGDQPISNKQLDELCMFLSDLLSDDSNLDGKMLISKAHYLNKIPIKNKSIFLKNND
ncbi:hypothetical protein C922_05047 [Plasmodium inui San Antonio 1]|uniref:Uncharacterized protein n=1 Tax=Plasmodium inui San Antonio 1 TaxID=1237626 RepID=W7AH37_9APIC|nr:hypothetical protein C922_05047 [Plasmodium inui San Antonio 1]EUD64576.1 hypothetical protein C922_05047 [Plasmodium inui San Antonio 1]